jgi:hypothetical protein
MHLSVSSKCGGDGSSEIAPMCSTMTGSEPSTTSATPRGCWSIRHQQLETSNCAMTRESLSACGTDKRRPVPLCNTSQPASA